MRVSIIICTHQIHRYPDLVEAINSLVTQSYKNREIIVVVDGNAELYVRVKSESQDLDTIIFNEKNLGLSESRNRGIEKANGDIIAFFDDDAVATENWLEELVRPYKEKEAIAVGGKIIPLWVSARSKFLPEEYYWLIGATHKGFPEEITEVRNTFGSNLSFKAEVLRSLGGFKSEMGVRGEGLLQGEETELCGRMKDTFGKGVVYNPQAIVCHKVFTERLRMSFLLRRAFWQGYSKRMMQERGYSMDDEKEFVKRVFGGTIERLKAKSLVALVQVLFLLLLTFATGLGYVFKLLTASKD